MAGESASREPGKDPGQEGVRQGARREQARIRVRVRVFGASCPSGSISPYRQFSIPSVPYEGY